MNTTQCTWQRFIAALIIVFIAATGVDIGPASAAGLTLGYDGDGIFPKEATANSQRWFRVNVTWSTTAVTDGTYGTFDTERVTGLYLEQFGDFNDTVEVVAPDTYEGGLDGGEGLKNFFTSGRSGSYLPGKYLSQRAQFGVYLSGSHGDYVITVGPFSRYEYSLLCGRMNQSGPFRFRLDYETYNTTSHGYVGNSAVYANGTHVTTPVVVQGRSNPRVSLVQSAGELQAWTSGVGTGLDPLTVTKAGVPDATDNGSGSDRYTFRTRYFSGLSGMPALPALWRADNHGSGDYHIDFDRYAFTFLTTGTHNHSLKQPIVDSQENDWTYDNTGTANNPADPHQDKIGDGSIGSYNPEAILIIDRDYNNPHYMQPETGSYTTGRDYRYDLLPTNYLQLLNNIFTLQFDTPFTDAWDTYASGVRGLPASNGYVAMRAGGHTYEFITTRDFHPPVAEITAEQGGAAWVGPRAIALRGRPGSSSSLEAVYVVCPGYHGQSGRGGHYTQRINGWVDDTGAGGYGYPYDSQQLDNYPKVNPVLSAHPLFQTGTAGPLEIVGGVPVNPEKGRPNPWSFLADLGPGLPGANANPFDPSGAGLPWGALNGPAGPQRFTNQDTIWPNFMNIWPETAENPFRGGKWTVDTNFVFRINYWQSDNFAPQYIQVFLQKVNASGTPIGGWQAFSMQKADPTAWNFKEGVVYSFTRSANELGGPGDYRYYFKASDGKGVTIYPNRPNAADIPSGWRPPDDPGQPGVTRGNNDYYWFRVNTRPQLSNASVLPASAPVGSDFTFAVTYADEDGRTLDAAHKGDPPFKSLVHIDYSGDSNVCTISGIGGNVITYSAADPFADNELVEMQVRRGPAFDSNPAWAISSNAGNTITVKNATGLSVGDTFRVWFTATMDPTSPVDLNTNYRAGVRYNYSTARSGVQLDPGMHRYYCEFWDNWAYWINWQQYLMNSSAPTPADYKVEGEMVRAPAVGFYEGPEIIRNTPPQLARFFFESPAADRVSGRTSESLSYTRPEGLPNYADNALTDMYVEILTGSATSYVYEIEGNDESTIKLKPGPWPDNASSGKPDLDGVSAGNTFRIFQHRLAGADGHYYLSGGFNTSDPDGTPATAFYANVTYTDLENNPPSVLRIGLLRGASLAVYNMQKVNPADSVYADGVEYRTNTPIYLDADGASVASYGIVAQANDGSLWYGSQYGETGGEAIYFGPLTPDGLGTTVTTPAKGPDIAPNQAPELGFVVGNGTVSAYTATNILTYNEVAGSEIGTDPVTVVDFGTKSYRAQSHNPATNTITLAPGSNPNDDGFIVGAAFEARAELDPPSGLDSDTYNYWLVYTDRDDYAGVRGNPPEYVRVYIDNVEFTMTPYDAADLDMTDGKVYRYSTNQLSVSQNHRYYFMAADGLDVTRLPVAAPEQYPGPIVHVNSAPILSGGAVEPASGTERDGTTPKPYVFTVLYTDPDGHAPTKVTLNVLNTSQTGATLKQFDMERDTSAPGELGDGAYTNGERFTITTYAVNPGQKEIGDGHHTFYFTATDIPGLGARDPAVGATPTTYDGPTINDPPLPPTAGFSPASPNYPANNTLANLTVTDDTTPRISWTGSDALDPNATDTAAKLKYTVEIATDRLFTTVVRTLNSNLGQAYVDVPAGSALANQTIYYYRVRTIDDDAAVSAWTYAGADPFAKTTAFYVDTNHAPYWASPSLAAFVPTGDVNTQTPLINWPDGVDQDAADTPVTLAYDVQLDVNSGFTSPVVNERTPDGQSQYQIVTPLAVGTTYYWRVRTVDRQGGISQWSTQALGLAQPLQFRVVPNHAPNPPTAGFIPSGDVEVGSPSPTLSWNAGTDPDAADVPATLHYEVQLDDNNDWSDANIFAPPTATTAAGVTEITVSPDLAENGHFWWRVRTVDSQGLTSDWSSSHSFYVNETNDPPTAPASGFSPAEGVPTPQQLPTIKWDPSDDPDPADTPASLIYIVQLDTEPTFTDPPYTLQTGAGVPSAAVTSALSRGTWYWRVRARDPLGALSAWSVVQNFEVIGNNPPTPPPNGFSPTGGAPVFSLRPTLSWNPGSDIDPSDTVDVLRYQVQVNTSTDWAALPLTYDVITPGGQTSATLGLDLVENKVYWYRVRTIDSTGAESDWTPNQMFWVNTQNESPAAPASGLRPNNGEETDMQRPPLNWNAGLDPDYPSPACQQTDGPGTLIYILELSTDGTFSRIDYRYSTTTPGLTQLVPTDDLSDMTTWYWRIRTVDSHGAQSPWSLVQYFKVNTNNATPVLSAGQVTPALGHLTTTYEFSVVYTDADNDPPIGNIMVDVGPGSINLVMARDPNDTSAYRDGVTYLASIRGDNPALGLGGYVHHYYIDGTLVRHPAAPTTIPGPVVHTLGVIRLANSAWADTSAYEEGDRLYIEVTDPDRNQKPGAPDTIVVRASEEGGDSETATLTETGNNNAVFRGFVRTLGRSGAVGDGYLNVISGPVGRMVTATWADPAEAAVGGSAVSATARMTDTIAPNTIAADELSVTSSPDGLSATVDWNPYVEGAQPHNQPDVLEYRVWQSSSAFTNISSATLVDTVPAGTQSCVVGDLVVGSDVYFAVTVIDEVPNENATVVAKRLTPTDTLPPQLVNWQYDAAAGKVAFDLTDLSGVDAGALALRVDGADVTGSAVVNDSDIKHVNVTYTAPGGWGYNRQVNFAVDVADIYGNAMVTFTAQEDAPVDDTAPSVDQFSPANGATDVAVGTAIKFRLRDSESGVDSDTVVMTVNGIDVSDEVTFGASVAAAGQAEVLATYQPTEPLAYDTAYAVHVEATDTVGNTGSGGWSFKTGVEPTFEVRGVVTNEAGSPMPGVQVSTAGNTAVTDANGVYRFRALTAGTYVLTPSFTEYDFAPATQQVTIGPDAANINFAGALRRYTISGRVTAGGSGVEGVLVSDGAFSATTDSSGNYTITGVPSGVYNLTPTRDADADSFQDFTYAPQARTANVEGANLPGMDFTATRITYTVAGTIKDKAGNPISGVSVSDGTRSDVTNEAGKYTITNVPPSSVTLTPTKTGIAFDPATVDVTVPPASTGNDFTAYTEFRRRFGMGLQLVAVPATPPTSSNRAVDIFGTAAVARWDASSSPQAYVFGQTSPNSSQLQVRPGAAYFVNFPAVTNVRIPGDPVGEVGTFSVGVSTGWNMVGNPWEVALPMGNIAGAGSTQLRPYGFIYDPSVGSYRMVTRAAAFNSARTYIEAWEGAWLRAIGADGSLMMSAPGTVASAMLVGADADIAAPDNGWLIDIVARVANRADLTTVAGVGSGDAALGYRVDNPPMIPGSVDVYFTDGSARLAHDIRPQSSTTMVWPFAVQTDIANAEVEVALPDLSAVPADMAVYLTDLDSGKRMYARTLTAYTFTSGADGALRHFELEVSPRGAENLAIRTASVQSAAGGMMVTYDLSSAASVSIEVLNIAGRSVRSLVQARSMPAGSNEQLWDTRNAEGTLVPNGSYLIRIEAVAENGQRVQALRPAQIAR